MLIVAPLRDQAWRNSYDTIVLLLSNSKGNELNRGEHYEEIY